MFGTHWAKTGMNLGLSLTMSRLCILLNLIVTAQAYAQPGKLVKLGSPQPESFEKRAIIPTYDDQKIEVLWIEPQKSTKAAK